jgi:hypothetical protein
MAVAVAADARSRGVSPWLWFGVTLLFNVFGVLAYLVIRPPFRLDEDVIESEPAEEPVPLPTPIPPPSAQTSRWERSAESAPRGAPRGTRDDPVHRPEPDYEADEEAYGPTSPATRTWLFVGGAIFLGLVVVAALFALITSPSDTAAEPRRAAATATAPAVSPTATPPAALLAPTPPPQPIGTPSTPPSPTARAGEEYVVQAGDTLTSIAGHYGVSVQELQDANGLSGETIQVGQRLTIPARQ